jgi:hypothetical protein
VADKIPVKARYSGSDVISLGELETGDTINASYISNLPSDLPATGADGNVLTSDGTNWASETPAGGGSDGWVPLYTDYPNNNSAYTMNNTFITSAYDCYVMRLDSLVCNGSNIWLHASYDNGTSWTSGDGVGIMSMQTTSNIYAHWEHSNYDYLRVTGSRNTQDCAVSGWIYIHNPLDAARHTTVNYQFHIDKNLGASNNDTCHINGSGHFYNQAACNAVKLDNGGSAMIDGRYTFYGLSHVV